MSAALACVALLLFVRRYIAAKMQVVDMLVQSIFTAEGHCGLSPVNDLIAAAEVVEDESEPYGGIAECL